jgi:transposase
MRCRSPLVRRRSVDGRSRGPAHLHVRIYRHGNDVRCVVESMTGARLVHNSLEALDFEVLIADAQRTKGLAPLACRTDRIDARVRAVLSERCLVPEIWLPDPRVRREHELARFRLHRSRRTYALVARRR